MGARKRKQTSNDPNRQPSAIKQAGPRRLRPLLIILAVLVIAWLVRDVILAERRLVALRRPAEEISSRPFAPRNTGSQTLFEQLSPATTGIDFTSRIEAKHPKRYLYETGFTGGGVAIGDVDGDDRPDLYFVSGPDANRLYRQVSEFRFEDVTERAGVGGGDAWGAGAAMADVNNDGRLDVYVCNYDSPNQLYINQGDGTFREQAHEFGLAITDACLMAAFADYDLDGDLDMYLLTNRYVLPGGRPARPPVVAIDGQLQIRPEYEKYYDFTVTNSVDDRAGRSDALFRNNGDGTFADVSAEAGLWGRFHGLSVTWWDYNEDGLPDIYVANDFNGPDQLLRNRGDGTFTDVTAQTLPRMPWFSMGSDAADVNNDGHIDLLVADMARSSHVARMTSSVPVRDEQILAAHQPNQTMWNALFLNLGVDRLMDVAYLAGVDGTNWTWAVKLADFDNDGRVDMFFSNGFTRDFTHADHPVNREKELTSTTWDITADQPLLREQNLAFRNRGDLSFEEISRAWGLDEVGIGMATAYADIDRDGDLDLIVANAEGPPSVYRNASQAEHSVLVRLEGARSNRFGLGATVRVTTKSGQQVRCLSPMTGYNSSNEPLVHFGLGGDAIIDDLSVEWPSGHRQAFRDLAADKVYAIAEPDVAPPMRMPTARKPTWFVRSSALREAAHLERPFNDFDKQPLLPRRLSQLGPGLALADVDQDGDDDLFLGGAAGQVGSIWINQGQGQFLHLPSEALEADRQCEDMGAVWFDADSDGDLDLFVASGGVEFGNTRRLMHDRLYWNDGHGRLTKAPPGTLPEYWDSVGPVAAADFDRDGDVDLLVGGRLVPEKYPLTPHTRLLRNDGGRFVHATPWAAPQLQTSGLVTGALWTDVDNDGWLDLMVTHEWGPVKLYRNREGRLVDETESAGLSRYVGWWNGITGRDIDGDGDIDYAATNFGLNTQYRATSEFPVRLYYGDFDDSGNMVQVEAYYNAGTLYPLRDKYTSALGTPLLKEKFKTHEAFGRASLAEVYSPELLSRAQSFSINTLESGVFLNDGKGVFEFRPLPRIAQASPAFGLSLGDFDADGRVDLYLVQNFFGLPPVAGPIDGGLSQLLRGDGRGGFSPIMPAESGLVVPDDAKSLAFTDLNGDNWPDFVIGVNNGPVIAYENRGSKLGQPFRVRLRGKNGNPAGVGSRVTVRFEGGSVQTAEVYAGDGYLSQSSAELTFGVANGRQVVSVDVRWPDGQTSAASPEQEREIIIIRKP
ncbi:MAG: FG-GAP-like repeat-containing protein [Pirellulales bacterium]